MSLLVKVLVLVVGLHPCAGNETHDAAFNMLSTELPERQKEIVDKHNELRRKVEPSASNMLKMKWNGTAAEKAKSWANECNYRHSPLSRRTIENDLECGENLFYSSVPKSWSEAIQAWFDERADYIYGVGPKEEDAVIGHYKQLIWYKSYLLACAVAQCQHDLYKYFYVCHYCPAGNVLGENFQKPYKEGEPCGDCPDACDDGLCREQTYPLNDKYQLDCVAGFLLLTLSRTCYCELISQEMIARLAHGFMGRQGRCTRNTNTNPCEKEDRLSNCVPLMEIHTCKHPFIKENCPGCCQCTTQIQ